MRQSLQAKFIEGYQLASEMKTGLNDFQAEFKNIIQAPDFYEKAVNREHLQITVKSLAHWLENTIELLNSLPAYSNDVMELDNMYAQWYKVGDTIDAKKIELIKLVQSTYNQFTLDISQQTEVAVPGLILNIVESLDGDSELSAVLDSASPAKESQSAYPQMLDAAAQVIDVFESSFAVLQLIQRLVAIQQAQADAVYNIVGVEAADLHNQYRRVRCSMVSTDHPSNDNHPDTSKQAMSLMKLINFLFNTHNALDLIETIVITRFKTKTYFQLKSHDSTNENTSVKFAELYKFVLIPLVLLKDLAHFTKYSSQTLDELIGEQVLSSQNRETIGFLKQITEMVCVYPGLQALLQAVDLQNDAFLDTVAQEQDIAISKTKALDEYPSDITFIKGLVRSDTVDYVRFINLLPAALKELGDVFGNIFLPVATAEDEQDIVAIRLQLAEVLSQPSLFDLLELNKIANASDNVNDILEQTKASESGQLQDFLNHSGGDNGNRLEALRAGLEENLATKMIKIVTANSNDLKLLANYSLNQLSQSGVETATFQNAICQSLEANILIITSTVDWIQALQNITGVPLIQSITPIKFYDYTFTFLRSITGVPANHIKLLSHIDLKTCDSKAIGYIFVGLLKQSSTKIRFNNSIQAEFGKFTLSAKRLTVLVVQSLNNIISQNPGIDGAKIISYFSDSSGILSLKQKSKLRGEPTLDGIKVAPRHIVLQVGSAERIVISLSTSSKDQLLVYVGDYHSVLGID